MLFDGWMALFRTLVVGVLSYAALIVLLRVTGKRTLSKWNAFDFVVTVAIGSTLATTLLSESTTLVRGVLALALLVGLQFVITWLSVRSGILRHWIKAEPALLLHQGRLLRGALRRERVTEGEIRAALRARGFASLDEAGAVVLETDGSFSVIDRIEGRDPSALLGVRGFPADTDGDRRHESSGPDFEPHRR